MYSSSSRVFASLAACSVALSLAACQPKTAQAPTPAACAKITDSKEKQNCVAAWNVAVDQCKKEEAAFNKTNKDKTKKFNLASCESKKFDMAMKKEDKKPTDPKKDDTKKPDQKDDKMAPK